MNTKVAVISLIIAVLFVSSGVIAYSLTRTSQNKNVEIVSNGEVLYSFDLSKAENQSFTVMSADGKSFNTVCIEDGKIFVSDAGCADKICVKSGELKSDGLPIVCLPNKFIIKFSEK